MADPVAIVSVIVSGVVTPSIAASYALHVQRQQHLQARRDELRGVLDDAAVSVGAARRRVEYLHHAWQTGLDPSTPEVQARIKEWRDALEAPRHALDRLAIRVAGNDPTDLLPRYEELLTYLDSYRRVLQGYTRGESYEAETRGIIDARQAVLGARTAFLSAAYNRVGIRPQTMSPLWPTMPLPDDPI
jgi:hypothetical protein